MHKHTLILHKILELYAIPYTLYVLYIYIHTPYIYIPLNLLNCCFTMKERRDTRDLGHEKLLAAVTSLLNRHEQAVDAWTDRL